MRSTPSSFASVFARAAIACRSALGSSRIASPREHLALEPLVAADRHVAHGAPVCEQPPAALDRPPGDVRVEEELRGAGVAQPRGLESLARLEALPRQLGATHPVEAERPGAVARPIPGVDVPVRQLTLEGVRLDEPGRGLRVDLLLVLNLDEPPLAHPAREPRDEIDFLGDDVR